MADERKNVQEMDRDLSFHPCGNQSPKTLTRQQIQQFNERGYVMPLDVFSVAEMVEHRAYFNILMEETARRGGNSYTINGYHNRCQKLYDLVIDPRILDYVEDLTGPDFIAWGTHYFCKTPHDVNSVPWHQDASYWPLTPAKTVTVWLAIDDVDVENSAMQFVAGSHTHGHIEFRQAKGAVVLGQEIVDAERFGEVVNAEMMAGQISLHADMLVHGSLPNKSDRRRCGLTIRYCPTEVKPLVESWGQNAVLCRGKDRYGHWRCHPRPEKDDYELPVWERKASK